MVAVSVVVATTDPGQGLLGLIRSIDAQTLRAAEFELIAADASTDGSAQRLQELAGRRSNVVVVVADPGTAEPALLDLARRRASADRVLVLAQDRRLAPRALELLLARAGASGADTVLGRVVGRAGSGSAQLPDDADRVDAVAIDPRTSVALVRRGITGGTLAAVGRCACAVGEGTPPARAEGIALGSVAIGWKAGRLEVDAEVHGAPPGSRAWLVAMRDTADLAVPAVIDAGGAVVAALDPATGESGRALMDGLWDLGLRVAWPDGEATLPLPAGPTRAAVIDSRLLVLRVGARGAQLDAGATLGGVSAAAPQGTATLGETVRGVLLTLEQPGIHVHGDADLPAQLRLDGFALRARLVCRNGAARVEAFVSGMAGSSAIALVVGDGKPVPTGLRLRVDGVGAMAVEAVEVAPVAPTAPPEQQPRAPAASPPLVQRVRRLAPKPLEPVVGRLSRVPVLRRAYRTLLSR